MPQISSYYDEELVQQTVQHGQHRDAVGGLWDQMGVMQRDFLIAQGLQPSMKVLDIGCGCLRAGVPLIAYLEPGHYYGVDISQELLNVGYSVELKEAGLQEKLPRSQLLCCGDFDFSALPEPVDMALAQSVFTHLPMNHIRQCLINLVPFVTEGGAFYATFFECPADVPVTNAVEHSPAGVVTHPLSDPYHYRRDDFAFMCQGLPWDMRYIGEWGHPRGQKLLQFIRTV